jgi:hypothetical protein
MSSHINSLVANIISDLNKVEMKLYLPTIPHSEGFGIYSKRMEINRRVNRIMERSTIPKSFTSLESIRHYIKNVLSDPRTPEISEQISADGLNITFKSNIKSHTNLLVSEDNGYILTINNPYPTDKNNSEKVGQITRSRVSLFSNTQFTLDSKLEFGTNLGFKIDVYSDEDDIVALTLKLEDKEDADTNTQITQSTTQPGNWETLTFSFDASNNNIFDKIVLFFDLDTVNEKIYYFDNLRLFQ